LVAPENSDLERNSSAGTSKSNTEGRDVAVTRGSTYENRANLPAGLYAAIGFSVGVEVVESTRRASAQR